MSSTDFIDDGSGEQKAFLGRGWAMPVMLDPRTGLVKFTEYELDIRQSILIILETAPGERAMRASFGCGIHEVVVAEAQTGGSEALRRYEARIDVIGIDVDEAASAEGELLVSIEYRVRKTNQVGNLVYPFYFREGGRP